MRSQILRRSVPVFGVVLAGAFLLSLLALVPAQPAYAASSDVQPEEERWDEIILRRYISPDIESTLDLTANYRQVVIVGQLACTEGEMYRVRAVVSQGTTGARAEGHMQDRCIGDEEHGQIFTFKAVARGPVPFAPGEAQICSWAETRFRGKVTDSFMWCGSVTLVGE